MSPKVNESIKDQMLKLYTFALENTNIKLDVSLKIKFNSVWLSSELINNNCNSSTSNIDDDWYLSITYTPTSDGEIKEFEQLIEKEIKHLEKVSAKLSNSTKPTKKGK